MHPLQCKTVFPVILFAAMLPAALAADRASLSDLEIPDISRRINAFTLDLLKQQAETVDQPANLILSPQSIFHGLAMSYIASGGATQKELQEVFHFPQENEPLLNGLADLRRQVGASAGHERIDVGIASSVWLDETYADFRQDYLNTVRRFFGSSLYRVRFEQRELVSDLINEWVSASTHGRIQTSVGPGDFESPSQPGIVEGSGLVTVNAVYFKADWASQFDKRATGQYLFHLDPQTTVQTLMMHQRSLLRYAEDDQRAFLQLPYIDQVYSMYVILPKSIWPVGKLVDALTIEAVMGLQGRASTRYVDVLLPKFEIRSHLCAKAILSDMGVESAFRRQMADFDKMIIGNIKAFGVYLREVYHDAWINVHEEGAEAAAATSTIQFSFGCSAAAPPTPVPFHADHPFLFIIVHNESRSILFAGWISDPQALAPADSRL